MYLEDILYFDATMRRNALCTGIGCLKANEMLNYEIEFRSTSKQWNEDMLSRLPVKETAPISEFNMLYPSHRN